MGRFSTLNTALTGMNVAQANLFVTGHNMANVNIPGYTRQQVIQADHFSNNIGTFRAGTKQLGLGANVQSIRQIRDKFLDMAFRSSASTLGFYNVSYNVGSRVQAIIGELEGEYRLQSVLRDFRNSISELKMDMGAVETRGEFIGSAIVFIDKANDMFNSLWAEQNRLNDQVKTMVRRINELIADINHYSQLVRFNEFAGDNANDFRDRVNMALDELAGYLDIDYRIGPNFEVTIIAEGRTLLSGTLQTTLGLRFCAPNSNLVEVVLTRHDGILNYDEEAPLLFRYDRGMSIDPLYRPGYIIDPRRNNDGGALKGVLAARGLRNFTHFDTPDQIRERHIANLAVIDAAILIAPPPDIPALLRQRELAELQFNRDLFTVNNSVIAQSQMKIDTLVNTIVRLINDAVAPRGAVIGTYQIGGPPPVDVNVYERATPFPFGQDGSQEFMPVFVRRGEIFRYHEFDPPISDYGILGEHHAVHASQFTIGNIIVNPELRSQAGYRLLAISWSGDMDDINLLEQLLEDWNSPIVAIDDQEPASIDAFYNRMVGNLGVQLAAYRTISESEAGVALATDQRRMQISGVGLDEEMANMLRFQHAFHAAARLFNYIDSMLDTIINGMAR